MGIRGGGLENGAVMSGYYAGGAEKQVSRSRA
jgi:hypothetical protein